MAKKRQQPRPRRQRPPRPEAVAPPWLAMRRQCLQAARPQWPVQRPLRAWVLPHERLGRQARSGWR
jgi:hypothetical protein